MSKQPEQESERRWTKGLRVRPVGWRFFDWPGDSELYASLVGTVVAPTYSFSALRWIDWWSDGADVWAIGPGWEVEPIPPIWERQNRPKPDRFNEASSLEYGRDHRRVVVWRDEEETFCDGEGRWAVDYGGKIDRYFKTWHEAIEYANELAYNRG